MILKYICLISSIYFSTVFLFLTLFFYSGIEDYPLDGDKTLIYILGILTAIGISSIIFCSHWLKFI